MNTKTVRRKARDNERDGDALSLRNQVYECCDAIDGLRKIINEVYDAWLKWGPTDDGTPEGERLEELLTAMRARAKYPTVKE